MLSPEIGSTLLGTCDVKISIWPDLAKTEKVGNYTTPEETAGKSGGKPELSTAMHCYGVTIASIYPYFLCPQVVCIPYYEAYSMYDIAYQVIQ